jgi:hypothetical protein
MKSMVIIQIQPRWWAWSQDWFIRCARREFMLWVWAEDNRRWASGLPGMPNPKHTHPTAYAWIQDRYIKGRGDYRIRLDFDQFFQAVTCNYTEADRYLCIPYYGRTAKATSYVKKPEHKPKDNPTFNAWRIEKHTKKDKSRQHFSRHARKFCSDQSARSHRAWVKQQINKENWDAFDKGACDAEYAQFVEPYDWD